MQDVADPLRQHVAGPLRNDVGGDATVLLHPGDGGGATDDDGQNADHGSDDAALGGTGQGAVSTWLLLLVGATTCLLYTSPSPRD